MQQSDRKDAGIPAPVALLRQELKRRGLDGFVIPQTDEHLAEYIPPSAFRLQFVTGFSGSAGAAIVLADRAVLFVDGRYTLQAAQQTDPALFERRHLIEEPPHRWLAGNLAAGQRIGYDPWLHTPAAVAQLRKACEQAGASLVAAESNPVDAVWADRPAAPASPVVPHPVQFSGKSAEEKRSELARELTEAKLDAVVISSPESVAWLLNLRGDDVPFTPVARSFAILDKDGTVDLFVDPARLSADTKRHLGNAVRIAEPTALGAHLDRLSGKTVRLDPAGTPAWIEDRLTAVEAHIDAGSDPCTLPRACKNEVEAAGMRTAHRRDGAALVRFLAWLEAAAPKGDQTELSVAAKLETFRAGGQYHKGPSFGTISAAGPNAALPHYHSTEESNRPLQAGEVYLVDSGGQYLDGTTDVTRTVAIGTVPAEVRRRFTQVLKGHIALARCRFPAGTTGSQLDVLARYALWAEGLDFDHGTGHGVGSYLSVHEGPHRIAKIPNAHALKPGMVVSNEPGYYQDGDFGIRIENLELVVPWTGSGKRPFLAFEALTLAPIDLSLVEPGLMDRGEIDWLNAYHARVRDEISPLVDPATATWLAKATRAI